MLIYGNYCRNHGGKSPKQNKLKIELPYNPVKSMYHREICVAITALFATAKIDRENGAHVGKGI